jgi:hypothetical protein
MVPCTSALMAQFSKSVIHRKEQAGQIHLFHFVCIFLTILVLMDD